ncbi:MAG: aminopeptidase P N-terminal domain-containing protein [Eubacteriales bacterium]
MSVITHREKLAELLCDNSMTLLYSGIPLHISEDDYFPFRVNRNFFYLTGLTRENMALCIKKIGGKTTVTLYIEEVDPHSVRWTGKMVTPEEAREISKIDDIRYISRLNAEIGSFMSSDPIESAYFDTERHSEGDLPDYNSVKAREFSALYPSVVIRNLHTPVAALRRIKDADEIAAIGRAIDCTKKGLEQVLSTLRPGMYEYQVQAEFEYRIAVEGAEGPSFATIAGSGSNGTMLHYETNREICENGSLILLDLGAKVDGYCADITRTYPVNGKYSPRQREYYDLVLAANRAVAKQAKPGMTLGQLNDICKKVLSDGLIRMGKIQKPEEVGKYYMHGVSHQLGIDVHDCNIAADRILRPGCVITDEPGLYIDEEAIGIRIEDDLLITEEGCEVLSGDIIRDPDEIEAFMAKAKG